MNDRKIRVLILMLLHTTQLISKSMESDSSPKYHAGENREQARGKIRKHNRKNARVQAASPWNQDKIDITNLTSKLCYAAYLTVNNRRPIQLINKRKMSAAMYLANRRKKIASSHVDRVACNATLIEH